MIKEKQKGVHTQPYWLYKNTLKMHIRKIKATKVYIHIRYAAYNQQDPLV